MDIFSKTVIQKHGRSYEQGQTIFSEGELCDKMFIINKGNVQIIKKEHGESVCLSTLGPGEFIGEMGNESLPRNVSAVAASKCTLVVIDSETFSKLLVDIPQLASKVINKLNQRIRTMNGRLLKTMTKDDPVRLALALMECTDGSAKHESIDEGTISSAAGVLPSTAASMMNHLSACKVLQAAGPGQWILKDKEGLRDFSEYCLRKKQMDPLTIQELAHLTGMQSDEAELVAMRVVEKRLGSHTASPESKELMTPLQRYLKLKLRFELHHSNRSEEKSLTGRDPHEGQVRKM